MKENTSFELTKLQAIEKQPGVIGFTNVDGNKVTLIATAHVSKKSVELVERVIKEKNPIKSQLNWITDGLSQSPKTA